MKLLEYLKKHNITQRSFSAKVGVTEAYISQILKGTRSPSIRLIQRISKETDRKVTIDDLANPEAPSRLKKRIEDE